MRLLKRTFVAVTLPLALVGILSGCGSGEAYNPILENGGGTGDFSIAVYQGTPDSIGSGQQPISAQNPLQVPFDSTADATIIVRPEDGFTGTVNLSIGQATGPFSVSNPTPSSVTITGIVPKDSSFTVTHQPNNAASRQGRGETDSGTAVVTATSGNITRTLTVYYVLAAGT